jgi:hypothetical protein
MTLPVVSVNDLPASILNGKPQAVNLPMVSFPDDEYSTRLCIYRFIRHTGQKLKQMFLEY